MKTHTKKVLALLDKILKKMNMVTSADPAFYKFPEHSLSIARLLNPNVKATFTSREELIATLDSMDPDDKQYFTVIAFLKGLPCVIPFILKKALKEILNRLPAPRSGAPYKLSIEDQRDVIDFIKNRQQKNPYEKLSESQIAAAEWTRKTKNKKTSPRTIRRIWDGKDQPKLAIGEMMQALSGFMIEANAKPVVNHAIAEASVKQVKAARTAD